MKTGYAAFTGAPVALVASTAKTILGVLTPATFGLDLLKIHLGMDSVTAANQPVLVELVAYTADGTGTAGTVNATYGRGTTVASIPVGFTQKYNYSVEPTGPTVLDRWSLTPVGGTVLYDLPLNGTPDVGINTLIGLRLTPGSSIAANANGTFHFERC
jgi:hypothetical protein